MPGAGGARETPEAEPLTKPAVPVPPTLHLIVGLPGAGKTTLARQLERDLSALRLTPDEWIGTLYGTPLPQETLDGARDPVERVQCAVALRTLQLGISVVLDFGFWAREERERFRNDAAATGARSQVHALLLPLDELWARVQRRNAALGRDAFHVSREQLELWWSLFEPPSPAELDVRLAPGEVDANAR
jgi:predicted kinase